MSVKRNISIWLSFVFFLIICIVAVGGITRLTDSGLSMVNWRPVYGILPPLNDTQWNAVFENYKSFPQYQQTHYHLDVDGFKKIFFWEYLHRILGRLIGLAIVIPFLYFVIRRRCDSFLLKRGSLLSFLVILQGLVGWIMVKSGLNLVARVSHFRLALHLSLAFLLCVVVLDTLLRVNGKNTSRRHPFSFNLFFIILCIQIIYGAFTAGLDAGFTFNTFPKMGMEWVPRDAFYLKPFIKNVFFNPICVQLIHRILGMTLFVFSFFIIRKNSVYRPLFLLTSGQFLLGVMTLLMHVPVALGVLHQLGALALLCSVIVIL